MPYDPKAVANYFLALADAQGKALSPLKIQKLVYFANGWHLAIKDAPIINEQVEAWPYGPVIPSLYRAFRKYGDQPVTEPAIRSVGEFHGLGVDTFRKMRPSVDDLPDEASFTKDFLNRILDVYGNYSPIQLSNLTHQTDTPWHKVYVQYGGRIPRGTDIPSDSMKAYFLSLARSKAKSR